ncbi:hypothetical protein HAX54_032609, partial [Datura stramonium]|nr:hypothetical protein [Datura stramonium]
QQTLFPVISVCNFKRQILFDIEKNENAILEANEVEVMVMLEENGRRPRRKSKL